MRKTIPFLLAVTFGLGACSTISESRVNPLNWFGKSRSEPVAQVESTNPLIPKGGGLFSNKRTADAIYEGRPFEQVTNLTIERVPGGAIIRATGLAARQGIYAVQLTPENIEELPVDGVLTYRLEGVRPTAQTAIGAKPTREVIAARHVTDQQLAGVRRIRVEGQLNAQVARR